MAMAELSPPSLVSRRAANPPHQIERFDVIAHFPSVESASNQEGNAEVMIYVLYGHLLMGQNASFATRCHPKSPKLQELKNLLG